MPGYRLQAKGIFLTYPQCPAPRQSIQQMLEAKGLNVVKGIVGQEQHADGNLHLHAYAKFDKPIDTKDCKYFDITYEGSTYHGKYEPAKSAIASIKYVSKHDKEPLELGDMDWKQETAAKECKKKILGKRLAQGEAIIDVLEDDNYELMFNLKQLQANVELYN